MSDRFKCIYIDSDGTYLQDMFMRNTRAFFIKKTFINSIGKISDECEEECYGYKKSHKKFTVKEIQDKIMEDFYRECHADNFNIDMLQLDGVYFVDFKDMKIYFGYFDTNKLQPELKEYYDALNDSMYWEYIENGEEKQKNYEEKQKILYNKINEIISPQNNGIPNYENIIGGKRVIYDFADDFAEAFAYVVEENNSNSKIAKELIKLAKSLIS